MSNELPNIWLMQTERDIDGLVNALQHPDAQIRKGAAVALRVIGAEKVAPALETALKREQDPDVKLAMTAALDHFRPGPPMPRSTQKAPRTKPPKQDPNRPQTRTERLVQHLTGSRPDLALQAARALGEIKDPETVPALVVVFRNKRQPPTVRLAAAEALLEMDSAPAEVTLLAALRSDKWHLRRNAVAILGRLQAEWAVQPLARTLYDPNELVARTASAALRRIGTKEARQALADARHAIMNTTDALDPSVLAKSKRIEQEKLGKLATAQLNPDVVRGARQRRKKGTSDLKPPDKKPQTGSLKEPLAPPAVGSTGRLSETTTLPQVDATPTQTAPQQRPSGQKKRQTQPFPRTSQQEEAAQERIRSRRRKSSTRRLVDPDALEPPSSDQ